MFFISFLALYYAVLVPVQRSGRSPAKQPSSFLGLSQFHLANEDWKKSFHSITPAEILLYIWIAGFAYDECINGLTLYADV